MAQTKREIQSLLSAAGINPLRRFGQHFLIDGNLMRKVVDSAELEPSDVVLEVGPGTGSLTELLSQRAAHVVAVEIDRGMCRLLTDRLGGYDNVTLLHRDVLESKSRVSQDVMDQLHQAQQNHQGRLLLVANLPYQIATPLIVDLATGADHVSPLCFTVQAEVADRLTAQAGSKAYGPVSVFLSLFTRVHHVAHVPPDAFWPVPKVNSAILRIDVEPDAKRRVRSLPVLQQVVHHCFNHRRKTMQANLKSLLSAEVLEQVAGADKWDLRQRPEQYSPDQWRELADLIAAHKS